jgi:hypothetical protein
MLVMKCFGSERRRQRYELFGSTNNYPALEKLKYLENSYYARPLR